MTKTVLNVYYTTRLTCDSSLKFRLLQFSLAVPSREQESLKISKSCVSLNDEAIFLCFVKERFASASEIWFISHVRWDKSWTPIMQCSTDPWNKGSFVWTYLLILTYFAESIRNHNNLFSNTYLVFSSKCTCWFLNHYRP